MFPRRDFMVTLYATGADLIGAEPMPPLSVDAGRRPFSLLYWPVIGEIS